MRQNTQQHGDGSTPTGFDSYNNLVTGDVSKTLDTGQDFHHVPNLWHRSVLRRITPSEAEKLQGLPQGHTSVACGKYAAEKCPDSRRYKAVGNSIAVNCIQWIGSRINDMEAP